MTTPGGTSAYDVDITRLLASPAFAGSRRAAKHIASCAEDLRSLLHAVETKRFGGWDADDATGRVYIDIACAVLEARIEELEYPEVRTASAAPAAVGAGDAPRSADPEPSPAPATTARLELFVATLHYFAKPEDEMPDYTLTGHVDDLILLRWVVNVAQRELPAG